VSIAFYNCLNHLDLAQMNLTSWIIVSVVAGLVCSPDGMMAIICNFKHIKKFKAAFIWASLITIFHMLFGVIAAVITVYAAEFKVIAMILIRVIGIALTGYFAYESIKEALDPELEDSEISFKEILVTTAVVGSVDAASFAHGTAIHLGENGSSGISSAVGSWILSSIVVGIFTLLAGIFAWKGGERLVREYGAKFLVIGAVSRVGLFFALMLMLIFALGEHLNYFHVAHSKQLIAELGTIILCGIAFYFPARKAQLSRMQSI